MTEGMQVLIIDEDENSRNLLVSLLGKRGYSAITSKTGQDGLQKAHDKTPLLIICDTNLSDLGVPELITRLSAQTNTASIPIVAISSSFDAGEMERCLTAGCVDYYGKSGMKLISLVDAIPKILQTTSVKVDKDSSAGLLSVFLSAKGGSGTSSICANIASCLAQNMAPSKVAVADLVLPMGSIAGIAGYTGEFDIVDVANLPPEEITSGYLLKNLIVQPNWNFHLLPGSSDPECSVNLKTNQIPSILEAMIKAFDYTLVDFGRALSKISLPIIQKADVVVIVMGNDLSAVQLTKKLCTYLQSQKVEPERMFLILNRAVGLEGVSKMEAEKIIGMPIRLTVPYMMSNFTLANNQNLPVPFKYPTDTATIMLNQASTELSTLAIKQHKSRN